MMARHRRRKRHREYAEVRASMRGANVVLHVQEPPPAQWEERERAFEVDEPMMGDPRPGRSALDKMGGTWTW